MNVYDYFLSLPPDVQGLTALLLLCLGLGTWVCKLYAPDWRKARESKRLKAMEEMERISGGKMG